RRATGGHHAGPAAAARGERRPAGRPVRRGGHNRVLGPGLLPARSPAPRAVVRAEIVGIGTEILLGQIANSNAQWMSERLAEIGVDVLHHQAVGDNVERIAEAFRLALSRSDVVI